MTSPIQALTQGTPTAASSLPFYDAVNGADRRASVSAFVTLLQTLLTGIGTPTPQYAAPAATGFSVTLTPVANGASVLLVLTPAAGYAAGTIVLPAEATCVDGQQVWITTTQAVNAVTINGNGATVNGAPTAFINGGAPAFAKLRFDGVFRAWHRIG